jgi:uncharacterized protein
MAAEPHFASVDPRHDDPFATGAAPLAARFCIYHPAQAPLRGRVVHVHAFGEEMNKSRRMVAHQARALAATGFAVLQFDLLGCGDSAGDHGEATWSRWLADVVWAEGHLRKQAGCGSEVPLWLWGQRVGALLAAQAAAQLARTQGTMPHLLFWQPTGSGKAALQQFLRLKAAAQLLDGGGKGVTESLKRALAEGQPVEVAGYRLHPELAAGLEGASLSPPDPSARVVWLELSTTEPAELLPASRAAIERWRSAGWAVEAQALPGPAFWQTTEIEDAPALVPHGTQALCS